MSFSHPKRSAYGALRHSRSSSTLSGLNEARHSRNCFQRRPLRASHSTQCLFPSPGGNNNRDETEAEENGGDGTTVYTTLTTSTYVQFEDLSDSDSEYSEYDLVNEQMQDFLLDSDDSGREEEECRDGVLGLGTYCVGGFLSAEPVDAPHSRLRRRTATPSRRRLAKKSESAASLPSAARMTPSSSTALLSDLDMNLRDAVTAMGHAQHRHRKSRRGAGGDRRWLVPAIAPITCGYGDGTPHQRSSRLPLFTVVFDLDETLVGARYGPIHLRPHVGRLLRALHRLPVEIIVWTAGTAHYVNPILHAIGQACGRREWFHHIISRHRRWYTGANTSVKDLTQLGRRAERVVMIENNPISVVQQPDACILVEDYLTVNAQDESLLVLQGVLERLASALSAAAATDAAAPPAVAAGGGQTTPVLHPDTPEWRAMAAVGDPLSAPPPCVPPLSALLGLDAALRTVEFRMEDVCNEDGVSMHQKVELKERVGGAETLVCHALCYSPALPASATGVSVGVRSYGCVNPLVSL